MAKVEKPQCVKCAEFNSERCAYVSDGMGTKIIGLGLSAEARDFMAGVCAVYARQGVKSVIRQNGLLLQKAVRQERVRVLNYIKERHEKWLKNIQ